MALILRSPWKAVSLYPALPSPELPLCLRTAAVQASWLALRLDLVFSTKASFFDKDGLSTLFGKFSFFIYQTIFKKPLFHLRPCAAGGTKTLFARSFWQLRALGACLGHSFGFFQANARGVAWTAGWALGGKSAWRPGVQRRAIKKSPTGLLWPRNGVVKAPQRLGPLRLGVEACMAASKGDT